jgi:hypothetical protein
MAAASPRLVVFVEHLQPLARVVMQAPPGTPGLEADSLLRFMSRADSIAIQPGSADSARCRLFRLTDIGSPPVAALTHLAEQAATAQPGQDGYWLRIDPLVLRPDRMRVFVLATGMADYDESEQGQVLRCMEEVLENEGLTPVRGHGHVRVALNEALPFRFLPLDRLLGMDLGDALPDHPDARPWRRLANELQIALHHLPVNQQRRQQGRTEINAAWAWGGGFLPSPVSPPAFKRVFSDHPVSQGMACLHGLQLEPAEDALKPGRALLDGDSLLDWTALGGDGLVEWQRLESLFSWLLGHVRRNGGVVSLQSAGGREWRLSRLALRRFWRRGATLRKLAGETA